MPKGNNIKWRKADETKLSRTVGKFNAKRTRLIKMVPELEDILPKKMSVKDLRDAISTRNDFNKTISRLERFLMKGAEDMVTTEGGVRTTKYQIKELQIQQRTINQYRAAQRKEANVSTEKGTMGSINKMNLRPLTRDVNKIKQEMWKSIVNSYEKQSMDTYYKQRDVKYKDNYLKALKNRFGNALKEDIKEIEEMKPEDVITMYYYDPNLQIDFVYDPEEEENMVRWFHETFQDYRNTLNNK